MSLRLDLINSMLATTGTAKLSAEDTAHPNYTTADDILRDVLEEFSSRPLWFNTARRTLAANSDGKVVVPSNALSCDPVDPALDYAIRGQYLFDLGNYTDIINASVDVEIVAELPLEDMPPIARQFVRAAARLRYYVDQDGSGNKVQVYAQVLANKEQELVLLNMKHTDANFFRGKSYASFATRRTAYDLPFTRIQ
jgi:DNA-binding protein Fis